MKQFTYKELANRLKVSQRTLLRWRRKRGLLCHKTSKGIIFDLDEIKRFVKENKEIVQEAVLFSRSKSVEKNDICERAIELRGSYERFCDLVERIAQEFNRSKNTVHQILLKYGQSGKKEKILYIYKPIFDDSNAEKIINIPVKLEKDRLTREQEYVLFRKYNYFKYKVFSFQKMRQSKINQSQDAQRALRKVRRWKRKVEELRNILIEYNLGLVSLICKRYSRHLEYDEIKSIGFLGLIRAIDRFDYEYGTKFSSYAVRVIRTIILKSLPCSSSVIFTDMETFPKTKEKKLNYDEKEILQRLFNKMPGVLNEREIYVIKSYFGLDNFNQKNLKEISQYIGVSKTRIGQIYQIALRKLRGTLPKGFLDYYAVI